MVEQLKIAPEWVVSTARFVDDLGADSLDLVELVIAFEEWFCVEISDEQACEIVTVGDAVAYLEKFGKR